MKLKEWADKQGISYLTAWRWFKAHDARLANAYQSDSGTIIVPDDSDALEPSMGVAQSSNDVMSSVLKKTVELSKTNGSVEDLAAWILSNFSLKPNTYSETPKYSRVKPKSEEVQNHFKQFLKPKGDKPKPNMFTADPAALDDLMAKSDDLTTKELVDEIHKIGADAGASVNATDAPEVEDLMKDLSFALNTNSPPLASGIMTSASGNPFLMNGITNYGDIAGGVVSRSVDLTPQQLNYTDSTNDTFSNSYGTAGSSVLLSAASAGPVTQSFYSAAFQPTQKEIESASRISSTVTEKPRRGRKSLKGKKQ